MIFVFFFSSRRRHTRWPRDWSSDVCSSDLGARETDLALVVIDGVPRLGNERLMGSFGQETERWRVGSAERVLNLSQETADPVVGTLTLREARDRLRDGLSRLPELARQLEGLTPRALADAAPEWSLVLDHEEPPGTAIRPRFSADPAVESTGRLADLMAVSVPLSELLIPLQLDPPTVADDRSFFDRLAEEPNLPDYVSEDLPGSF